ncbi:hypothetical protein, partial [Streptococcus agalactiae]|uniref:hypothetical protein n=1 Tax=Streptococcus agalactiae TaxID=1311 RepID=UPI00195538D4
MILYHRFGTIRNSTALKRRLYITTKTICFGTIRNSTALKLESIQYAYQGCFGTIRNSTALKRRLYITTKT